MILQYLTLENEQLCLQTDNALLLIINCFNHCIFSHNYLIYLTLFWLWFTRCKCTPDVNQNQPWIIVKATILLNLSYCNLTLSERLRLTVVNHTIVFLWVYLLKRPPPIIIIFLLLFSVISCLIKSCLFIYYYYYNYYQSVKFSKPGTLYCVKAMWI